MANYLTNSFLLILPVLLWNIVFYKKLPQAYIDPKIWDNIPIWLQWAENISRIGVFTLPLLLVLSTEKKSQKIGLALYLIGLLAYFSSWLVQIYLPKSSWSISLMGFMAPAYTTIIWLIGIGLIGQQSFLPIPRLQSIFLALCVVFVSLHSYHAYLVYE